jgi:hypothetical protein
MLYSYIYFAATKLHYISNHIIMKKIQFILFILSFVFISCSKEHQDNPAATSELILHLDNVAGSANLALNTGVYTNSFGEAYSISRFDYYISNIIIKSTAGLEYKVPQEKSYFLIKENDLASQEIELTDVPVGDYNIISFTLGIDSLKSAAPLNQRLDILDPANAASEMYWNSNNGYIFLKMEGSAVASPLAGKLFQYLVGGYGGSASPTINNIKNINLAFPVGAVAKVREGAHSKVHILADAKKVLDGSSNISIAASPSVWFTDESVKIANNYKKNVFGRSRSQLMLNS